MKVEQDRSGNIDPLFTFCSPVPASSFRNVSGRIIDQLRIACIAIALIGSSHQVEGVTLDLRGHGHRNKLEKSTCSLIHIYNYTKVLSGRPAPHKLSCTRTMNQGPPNACFPNNKPRPREGLHLATSHC